MSESLPKLGRQRRLIERISVCVEPEMKERIHRAIHEKRIDVPRIIRERLREILALALEDHPEELK